MKKMTDTSFLQRYCRDADSVCSGSISDLNQQKLAGNYGRLDLAVNGLTGEAGEVADLWKKVKFHGKVWDEELREEMIKELGDICWYLCQASLALDVPLEEIFTRNIAKLKERHPHKFSNSYMKKGA